MITLDVKDRKAGDNLAGMRAEGLMPAVFYGKKTDSTPISISQTEFVKVWKKAGESGVVTLQASHGPVDVLIREVALDPVTDMPIHADFYVFEKGKKLEISVPLEFVGVSPAVKDLGGSLVKVLHELKISAEPQNLPHSIEVDISPLAAFDSVILAGDIKLPRGVELIELPTEVVASAAAPKEDEPETTEPVDLSAIEVEKKGKKEEEGEGEAPAAA